MEYEGLRATSDHPVWVQGKTEPVQLGIAAACGAHLIQTGNGRDAVRMGGDHFTGETVGQPKKKLFCTNRVSRVWQCTVDKIKRFTIWAVKGVSKMFPAKAGSQMAGTQADESKATMQKPKLCRVQGLWGTRYQIRFSERVIGGDLDNRESWPARQEFGNRPDRQQWKLCSRKYPFCNKGCELWKQKNYSIISIRAAILAFFAEVSLRKTIGRADEGTDYTGRRKSSPATQGELASDRRTARVYDIRNAGRHHRFTVSGRLVHNCGYGGGIGALTSMGALDMGVEEAELPGLIADWRRSNPHITQFWWEVDAAAIKAVTEKQKTKVGKIIFEYKSGILFITLPSGRKLSYVKPRMAVNKFGRDGLTYEGISENKKWSRIETYGPKLVENIVQGTARDLLAEAMLRVEKKGYPIVMHCHDEIIAEVPEGSGSVDEMCEIMAVQPEWAEGLPLRADGYQCSFYQKM